jgi:serine/threonine protein kinase
VADFGLARSADRVKIQVCDTDGHVEVRNMMQRSYTTEVPPRAGHSHLPPLAIAHWQSIWGGGDPVIPRPRGPALPLTSSPDLYPPLHPPGGYQQSHLPLPLNLAPCLARSRLTLTLTLPGQVSAAQGRYTAAIDMWSAGCIFYDLLQSSHRRPGQRAMMRKRLFRIHAHDPLRTLKEVVDIMGTPAWSDIERLPNEAWRAWLKSIPGSSGNLRQLCAVEGMPEDPVAMDLLERMLSFNPDQRCSPAEALVHKPNPNPTQS